MKTYFLTFFQVLMTSLLIAQHSKISGTVSIHNSGYENNGNRKFVPNAQVEDKFEQSTATITNADGYFRLKFVGVPEKTTVFLLVNKEGLEVVNLDALKAVTGQLDTVRISMASPKQIAEFRKKIYQVGKTAAEKNIELKLQRLQNDRNRLKENEAANLKRIRELEGLIALYEEQKQQIKEDAQELARRYSAINLDDASRPYQKAFSFFQKGELEQALTVLRDAALTEQAEKILRERDRIAEVREEINQRDSMQRQRTQEVIQGLAFKADLHKTRFEFDSTAACFEIMLELDPSNGSILRQYAYFLASQKQFAKAIPFYKKALQVFVTDEKKSFIFNHLGNAYRANAEPMAAGEAYIKALRLFRTLAAEKPNEFLPYLALVLNNLGNLYREETRFDDAEEAFTEALEIYKQLAEKDKVDFQPYISLTWNNLGRLYYENKKWNFAKNAFEKALVYYEQLARDNPMATIPSDIFAFVDISLVYLDNDKKAMAFDRFSENFLKRALKVHRQFAIYNPDRLLPIIALTLNNLGYVYSNQGNYDAAEKAYREALKIHRDLASKNPNAFFPLMAFTLKRMGAYYEEIGEAEKAETAFLRAQEIEQKYGKMKP